MRQQGFLFITALATMLPVSHWVGAQTNPDGPRRQGGNGGAGRGEVRMPTPAFRTEVPAHPVDLILGRPTKNAITLSVLAYEELEGYVA